MYGSYLLSCIYMIYKNHILIKLSNAFPFIPIYVIFTNAEITKNALKLMCAHFLIILIDSG